ncbi:MAG: hypothetical protein ACYC8W_01245 [Candidatus Tyrphobacter sp.]
MIAALVLAAAVSVPPVPTARHGQSAQLQRSSTARDPGAHLDNALEATARSSVR